MTPITGRTRVFGLVGHPVRHSLSPEMHNALFERLGLDAVYLAFDVHPDRASEVAQAVRTLDLVGVNLTVPFKERVMPHLDHLTVAAREAGAVNVVINVGGHLTGYNTDGEGLVAALGEEHGWTPAGKRCVVLGAGGTGRAVAASLGVGGAAEVHLVNRTVARAERACEQLSQGLSSTRFTPHPFEAGALARLAPDAQLVVNCLAGGAEALVAGISVAALPDDALWVDVNYWMRDPPLVQACRTRGLRVSEGLGMLVHQGALSFELFTGHPVDGELLREIALRGRQGPSG